MHASGKPIYSLSERWNFFEYVVKSHPTQLRYLFRWLRSLHVDYLVDHAIPWITFGAMDFIARNIKRDDKVFEYGSGGSTLFWARQAALCVSIEHDQKWFAKMNAIAKNTAIVDYRFVSPLATKAPGADVSDPKLYLSSDPPWQGYSFENYVKQIDLFPDGYFNWVLIDGRARPSCIRHAVSKVRPGSFLVLDNADRPYYTSRAKVYLEPFVRRRFAGVAPCVCHVFSTDIYQKPS